MSEKCDWRSEDLILRKREKERTTRRGHGSAHGEEKIKGGAALWGQRDRERKRGTKRGGERMKERERTR